MSTAFIIEAEQESGSEGARSLIGLGQGVVIGARGRARARGVAARIGVRFVLNEESLAVTAASPARHDDRRER